MTYALLFPGQGAQRCGMLHQLPAGAETDRTLAEAADVLGRAVPGTLDDADAMRGDTVAIQLALVIAGTATARTLTARAPDPGYCAGHSVGAVTAAVAAGVLDLPDALDLVRLRGTLMARAYPAGSGHGMAGLSGLPERRVDELAAQVRSEGLAVYASNVNAPDQVTASGSLAGIDRLVELARVAGLTKAVPLAVPVPAHCQLSARSRTGSPTARRAAGARAAAPPALWVGRHPHRPGPAPARAHRPGPRRRRRAARAMARHDDRAVRARSAVVRRGRTGPRPGPSRRLRLSWGPRRRDRRHRHRLERAARRAAHPAGFRSMTRGRAEPVGRRLS